MMETQNSSDAFTTVSIDASPVLYTSFAVIIFKGRAFAIDPLYLDLLLTPPSPRGDDGTKWFSGDKADYEFRHVGSQDIRERGSHWVVRDV
jgi:hypothetical protein